MRCVTESDAEQLLESNKRQKIQDGDEEEDTLLDEIVQSMNETEKTDAKISEKLAKIVAKRRLNKLSDGQLKEKTEKYLRPANCDNLKSPKSQTPKYGNDLIAKHVGETLSYRHFGQLPLKWDTFAQKLPNFCCKPDTYLKPYFAAERPGKEFKNMADKVGSYTKTKRPLPRIRAS